MEQFANLDQFKNHVNSAAGVFAHLELSSEKHDAIQHLRNVVETLESSLVLDDDGQRILPAGSVNFNDVGKLWCQDKCGRTADYMSDVSIRPPSVKVKCVQGVHQENSTKEESSVYGSKQNGLTHSNSEEDYTTEMRRLVMENGNLKEELWKVIGTNVRIPPVTPCGVGDTVAIIRNVIEELIGKAVLFAELSRGPVDVVDFLQRHLIAIAPIPVKRKRGRPPKCKQPSLIASPPILTGLAIRGRRKRDPGIIGNVNVQRYTEEGEEVLERKRRNVRDEAVREGITGRVELEVLKTSKNNLVSDSGEDSTRKDIKTGVSSSAEVTNVDSDSTVIYDDEQTETDAPLKNENAIKRDMRAKAKFRSKTNAMPARHKCEICRAAFSHGRPFKRHLLKHGEGNMSCRRCHTEFQNFALHLHHHCRGDPTTRNSRGVEQKCDLCDETFRTRKRLQHHMSEVHSRSIDPAFFCEYCEKGFIRKASLFVHYKQHADGQYVCTKCGRFFEDEKTFDAHAKTHVCATDYTCKKCDESFTRKQQFEQHMTCHKKYDCVMCGEPFVTSKLLDQHNKDEHDIELKTSIKTYGCDYCGKQYPRPGLLELHLRTHTGEKPLECASCCLFFRTPKALYRHRQTFTHTQKTGETKKERSHLCATCGRAYFRKQALDRHMRYHSGVKPYRCPHCPYETREHNNLKRHVALHFSRRDFICEACGDAFHAKKTLEVHVLYKHSDERPLHCGDCDMTFKTPNSLKRHRLIHQNLRLHKCSVCEMSFNRFYNLRRHMRMVHGTEESLPAPNKVRVLDAPAGQEYRRPYHPPVRRSVCGSVSKSETINAENPVFDGSSVDHQGLEQYTGLMPSIRDDANLTELVVRNASIVTPSMLPQVNYAPAVMGDPTSDVTLAVPVAPHLTMTTLQGLYPHPTQPLLHHQAPVCQPPDPHQHLLLPSMQPPVVPGNLSHGNLSHDNQTDFSSLDIYSNLLRLMHRS